MPSHPGAAWRPIRCASPSTARCCGPGRTGVGYYTEHLLHHLAQVASNDELIVVSNRAIDTTSPLPPRVRIATPSRRVPRMVWMQTMAVTALREVEADVVHFTNGMVPLFSPVPTVVTIHDMSLRLYPRYHPARRVLLNRPLVDLAARRADAIITVSESAKRDIVSYYRLDPKRVHVVYEAAAPSFKRGRAIRRSSTACASATASTSASSSTSARSSRARTCRR